MALDEFQKAMRRARYHYARSEEILDEIRRSLPINHAFCSCNLCRHLILKHARLWAQHKYRERRVAEELGRALGAAGRSNRRRRLVFRFSDAVCIGIKQK